MTIEVLPETAPEFEDWSTYENLTITQGTGFFYFELPPYADADGTVEDIEIYYDFGMVTFGEARNTDTPLIVFHTDLDNIVGAYEVLITLVDLNINYSTYTLHIDVVEDYSSNSPPYFDEDWFDALPVQLFFDQTEVTFTFPQPLDDEFNDVEIRVDMIDIY